MKLYSKKQMIFFMAAAVIISILLTCFFFLFIMPGRQVPSGDYTKTDTIDEIPAATLQARSVAFSDNISATGDAGYTSDEIENIEIYKRLNEGVVNITSITIQYNWFLEPTPQEGTGSGSIIDQEGHVLTNYHVVEGADKLTITLADGSDYEGKIVGTDPENDLAIVKFNPGGKKLTTIPISKLDTVMIGQKVLAIGNPFGLERTLTTGVISAQRPVKSESGLIMQKAIQTDASINPGNSGGPLIDSRGEMIGINTMIYSPSGGSVGIGFAVPVVTAKRVIPDLITYGKVKRGWIDIRPVQISPPLVRYAKLPVNNGLLISEVDPGGNADKAGIRGGSSRSAVRSGRNIIYLGGDIIVEIDGMVIKTVSDLYSALEDNKPGDVVEVKVMRDRKLLTFSVKLSERPDQFQW